jgi:hypothetical protein
VNVDSKERGSRSNPANKYAPWTVATHVLVSIRGTRAAEIAVSGNAVAGRAVAGRAVAGRAVVGGVGGVGGIGGVGAKLTVPYEN